MSGPTPWRASRLGACRRRSGAMSASSPVDVVVEGQDAPAEGPQGDAGGEAARVAGPGAGASPRSTSRAKSLCGRAKRSRSSSGAVKPRWPDLVEVAVRCLAGGALATIEGCGWLRPCRRGSWTIPAAVPDCAARAASTASSGSDLPCWRRAWRSGRSDLDHRRPQRRGGGGPGRRHRRRCLRSRRAPRARSSPASRAARCSPALVVGNDSTPSRPPMLSSAAATWTSRWVSTPPVTGRVASTMVIAIPFFKWLRGGTHLLTIGPWTAEPLRKAQPIEPPDVGAGKNPGTRPTRRLEGQPERRQPVRKSGRDPGLLTLRAPRRRHGDAQARTTTNSLPGTYASWFSTT